MRTQYKITTPIPTMEETADRLGVSRSRLKELIKIADEIVAKRAQTKKRPAAAKKRKSIKRVAK